MGSCEELDGGRSAWPTAEADKMGAAGQAAKEGSCRRRFLASSMALRVVATGAFAVAAAVPVY